MGSLSSCNRRKNKPENADNDHQRETADTKTEDVLYASIDHSDISPNKPVRDVDDNDCDYAVVMLPQNIDSAKLKSNEDCSDDYVLMG
ncbi:hypothetical protein cypCar_00027168 [Cyprinus carpio]|nr:hypothetical protein cypCar_00027168 [Cyprinus carpio]